MPLNDTTADLRRGMFLMADLSLIVIFHDYSVIILIASVGWIFMNKF